VEDLVVVVFVDRLSADEQQFLDLLQTKLRKRMVRILRSISFVGVNLPNLSLDKCMGFSYNPIGIYDLNVSDDLNIPIDF